MSEPDSQCGQPLPDDAAAAKPDKPRGGRLFRLGEAILDALRDLTSVIVALRSLIAEQVSGGIPAGRQRRDYIKPKPLAERVQKARETQRLTRADLARMVGTTYQTIEKYERGMIRFSKFEPKMLAVLGLRRDDASADATAPAPPLVPDPPASEPQGVSADSMENDVTATQTTTDPRLDIDYEYFAGKQLWILPKSGGDLVRLAFNRVQRHVHALLEAQRAKTGRVRAIILKGRQQGCSTYVGGRFYHRVTHMRGQHCFILTHEEQATQTLFRLVDVFLKHVDDPPSVSVANANELYFDELNSGYKVATAGTKGVGRSSTVQLFHGSEVALWPHAQTHVAGVMQAVPDLPGTEIILESTAQGFGNLFHRLWRDAEAGTSEYLAIFVPWYWDDGYRKTPGENFTLDADEREYAALYGLDDEQMAWRRAKIATLPDAELFKQEYPASSSEAFLMSGHESFIPPALIAKARKARCEASGPLVIGYDPAWLGDDRHSMAWRRGRRVLKVESRTKLDTVQGAGWVRHVIDTEKPAKVFIDVTGVGAGVYDQLKNLGAPYSIIVEGVSFNSSPIAPPPLDEHGKPYGGPLNRRVEIWNNLKQWLEEPAGVQIPDSDSLQADLCGPAYHYDSLGRLVLESKEDMRRRKVLSPDEGDAVALTFARPVGQNNNFHRKLVYPRSGLV